MALGRAFPPFCRLYSIVSEITTFYARKDATTTALLAFALTKYHMILSLVDSLPDTMTRSEDGAGQPAFVLMFQ
jgi:hypothetical protein